MAPATVAQELVFGPLAGELNPRVLAAEDGRCLFALRARGLPARDRALLGGLPTARFETGGDASERFSCRTAELAAITRECVSAELLVTTLLHYERAPEHPEPVLMGVVNVTPDSFSDGGRFFAPERAVEHGLSLAAEGAALLDVGGESTRPGATPVPADEELRRVLPVVTELARTSKAGISIDTTKAEVARAALDAGATLVNDVSGGRADPGMLALVAERGCRYVVMHMQGAPSTMQASPRYADAVAEVTGFLRARGAACLRAGIRPEQLVFDPGIGFGKRLEHNLDLIRRLPELRSLGRPLLLGVSRKSFIGHLTGKERQEDWRAQGRSDRAESHRDRIGGSAAAVTACVLGGAEILRVHDVRIMGEAARVAAALVHRTPQSEAVAQ